MSKVTDNEYTVLNTMDEIKIPTSGLRSGTVAAFMEMKNEFVRKGIHFLIALTPALAAISRMGTVVLLTAGVLFYIYSEFLRLMGVDIPVVSKITKAASRARDKDRFVLGPITLGIGALVAILVFPPECATIAIYALAFGDGFASLIGRVFGAVRPAFLFGKSLEGSIACLSAAFFSTWFVSRNIFASLTVAVAAAIIEALPLEDWDNIAIPVFAGLAATLFLGI